MEIPLFPLHTVLCPGIALPLHVFEPRYRLLTRRCVEEERPFGIVLIREGREVGGDTVAIAGVGTFAEIRQATPLPDGRFDLLVVGAGRFAVESVDPEREPYLVASVTPLEDEVGDQARAVRLASRVMRRFVAYLHLLQPLEGETAEEIDVRVEIEAEVGEDDPTLASDAPPEASTAAETAAEAPAEPASAADVEHEATLEEAARRLVIPDDPTTLSYLLSGIVQVPGLQRQVLLECDTTEERLVALDALLDRELWLLRRRLRLFTPDPGQAAARRN
jgi:Lon protease-like protein